LNCYKLSRRCLCFPSSKIILEKIEEDLPERAGTFPSLTGKFTGLRKYRVGDYRVIYSIINDTALILRINHRLET